MSTPNSVRLDVAVFRHGRLYDRREVMPGRSVGTDATGFVIRAEMPWEQGLFFWSGDAKGTYIVRVPRQLELYERKICLLPYRCLNRWRQTKLGRQLDPEKLAFGEFPDGSYLLIRPQGGFLYSFMDNLEIEFFFTPDT